MATKKDNNEYFSYKGLPLVRCKNYIYYGDPSKTHIIFLTVISQDEKGVPTKVSVELLLTDETLPPNERLLKKSEKKSLYDALDIGCVWLERALKNKEANN